MRPLDPILVARTLPIGAAGLAGVLALVSFLPRLEEMASKKIPDSLKNSGDLQIRIENVKGAAGYFQLSLGCFAISLFTSLVYIGLSEVYIRWMPVHLIAVGSYLGPILSGVGAMAFGWAVFLWTNFYLFLLRQRTWGR